MEQPTQKEAQVSQRFARLKYERRHYPKDPVSQSRLFYQQMNERRTIREFSPKPIPQAIIENCLLTAGTAPSGAHRQPWSFCVISDKALKSKIREAAEHEEGAFYNGRAPQQMLEALAPLGTNATKRHIDEAPYLIAIFSHSHQVLEDGQKKVNYYVSQSVGLATGMLITALHQAGLATLTHTPSPMSFLSEILKRPAHEKPFLLLATGYPHEEATVPLLKRKRLEEIAQFY